MKCQPHLVVLKCLIFCILFVKNTYSQNLIGVQETQINYCRLISAGLYYGHIESEYTGILSPAIVDQFNGKWRQVYAAATYQRGISRDELTNEKRFSFGNKTTFPQANSYHRDHPDGYLVFHLAREAGRIQSPKHAACAECVSESIDNINSLLRGTRLERQLGEIWVGTGVIKRVATTQDVKDLVFYLQCLFYDSKVNPVSPLQGLNLAPLASVPDTTIIECKDDIRPEISFSWRHCELAGKLDTIGPVLVSGIDDCPGAVYRYTFIAKDVCNRVDSVHQFFVIDNAPPEVTCHNDTILQCIDQLNASLLSYEKSCGLAVYDSVYGPVLISGAHNCPEAVYEMEYFIIDSCGRAGGCIQRIEINNEPPTIDCPPDEVVSCPDQITPSAPLIAVACELGYDLTTDPPVLVSGLGTCPGDVYEISYTVRDICGRASSCVQRFIIDNAGPVIQCPPGEFVTCLDDISTGVPEVMETACGMEPDLEVSDPVLISGIPECGLSEYIVTYTITDECGRTASCDQLFTLIDLPVEVDCPEDRVVACKEDISTELPVVRTACPVAYTLDHSGPDLVQGTDNCPGAVYEIRYQYRDACGGEKLCIQRFTIENDPPEIACPPDRIVESVDDIEVDPALVDLACDLDYDLSFDWPVLVSGTANCPDAVYEVTHRLEDVCGRIAECVQSFTISNAEPEITCPPGVTITCAADIVAEMPDYKVSAGLDYTLDNSQPYLISGQEDCPGAIYGIEYTITDDCGRSASCEQLFTIVDNDPPTITCPPDLLVKCVRDIHSAPPVVTSSCQTADFDISDPVLIQGNHNCRNAIYEVTYTVTDHCNRTAMCVQRYTLTGEPIDILCPPDTTIQFGDPVVIIPPRITPSCGLTYQLISDAPRLVEGTEGLPGAVYHINHHVTDECNNMAACTQRVDVIGLVNDGRDRPLCDCYRDRRVDRAFVEDRTLRFLEDVAHLTKLYGCKKVVEWAKHDVTALWNAWSVQQVIGGDAGYASWIATRGSIDFVMQNISHFDKAIEILEEAISGEPKKAIGIFSEYAMLQFIKSISGSGTPGLVYAAVKSLGEFAKYMNQEIMISNIKTYADYADRDPNFFHPDTFLLKYAQIREIKPGDPITWNDIHNRHRIQVYLYAQVNGMALPRANEIWSDQRKMNNLRAVTRTMLNEVCDYWCYRNNLERDLHVLKHEQSVLWRFKYTFDHLKNMQCTGDVICDMPNMEVRHIDGRDTCVCIAGHRPDPTHTRCVPYDDCSQRPNTVEVFLGDRYGCACEAGFRADPTETYCVPYDDCGQASHVSLAFDPDMNRYVCVCDAGYKWNPRRTDCVPVEDCSNTPNSVEVFKGDRYGCDCAYGFRWDPTETNCVPAEDCSTKPNTNLVFRQDAWLCDCLPGYVMRADGTGCDAELNCPYPNTIPVWNQTINDYECDCKPGYKWNADYTACEVVLDCSLFPNSVPMWNPVINDYECDCPNGYEWNYAYSHCVETAPDCSRFYANTIAIFNPDNNRYECDCLPGYTWNVNRDGCIEAMTMICDIPNTVVLFDRVRNEYYCECEPGYRWNARKTRCVKRSEPMDPEVAQNILSGLVNIMTAISGEQNPDYPIVSPEHQHKGVCNTQYRSGANAPEQYTIDVGQPYGSVTLNYETYVVKDRIQVYNGGRLIFDSGCVGTRGTKSTTLQMSGSSVFRIVVNPLCDPGESNTQWHFTLGCP